MQNLVKSIALEWTKYANIKFQFDSNAPATEIRISFKSEEEIVSSWSYIGKFALEVPQNKPTMILGGLAHTCSDASIRGAVLHGK